MKRNLIGLLTLLLGVGGCMGTEEDINGSIDIIPNDTVVPETADTAKLTTELIYNCVLHSANLPILNSDTVYEKDNLPITDDLKGRILFNGRFHNDEIKEEERSMKWIGLFKAKNYFFSEANVTFAHAFDPVLDVDSALEKTGWRVAVKEGDVKCEFMFAKLPSLKVENEVKSLDIPKKFILPGDTFDIVFGDYNYKIYATGFCEQPNAGEDYYELGNFRMFMEETYEGNVKKQLIMAQHWFNENRVTFLFVGDLDGDQRLDLIIDKSYHYNAYMPTLFLSSSAKKGEIVKCMASRTTLGC